MAKMIPLPGTLFITITLPPKAYRFKAAEQFMRVKPYLLDAFQAHAKEYCLIAELTGKGNVHFHGWFNPRYDKAAIFLLDTLKQRHLGMVKINDEIIKETERTYRYMIKDLLTTKRLICQPVISSKPILLPLLKSFLPNGVPKEYKDLDTIN